MPSSKRLDELLSKLYGQVVEHVGSSPGTIALQIAGGWIIAIYNPVRFESGDGTPIGQDLVHLVGSRIVDFVDSHDRVTLCFDPARRITIDLSEAAGSGPEALLVRGPDNLMVVWN